VLCTQYTQSYILPLLVRGHSHVEANFCHIVWAFNALMNGCTLFNKVQSESVIKAPGLKILQSLLRATLQSLLRATLHSLLRETLQSLLRATLQSLLRATLQSLFKSDTAVPFQERHCSPFKSDTAIPLRVTPLLPYIQEICN
jgi:hypothetical protein